MTNKTTNKPSNKPGIQSGLLTATTLLVASTLLPAMAANKEQSGQNRLYPQIEKSSQQQVTAASPSSLSNAVPVTNINGASGSELIYTFEVAAGVSSLIINTNGGTGDADLYVRYGSAPTTSSYDCRPYLSGNTENCDISNIQTGRYYIMLRGYSAYTGLTLTATTNGVTLPTHRIAVAGDSITKAFSANCTANWWWWDLLCPAGGDQEQHSWFDGSNVYSVLDRYKAVAPTTTSNQSAAISGSEMRGGDNNLVVQANKIINQPEQPNHVEIVLGGNDICNRGCVDPANCSDPIYTDEQWRQAVRDGLDVLMTGMPNDNASILIGSVPRVQDIRQAGLDLEAQNPGKIDCQYMWTNYNVCSIVTQGGLLNGETVAQRHAGVTAAQQRYNQILAEEAAAYDSNSNGKNVNGIQVTAEYVDEATPSAGTFHFGAANLNGGDCFHPNVATQNTIAQMLWNANNSKP